MLGPPQGLVRSVFVAPALFVAVSAERRSTVLTRGFVPSTLCRDICDTVRALSLRFPLHREI
jgi:hypothetical protein